jgi:hypothetical protein
MLLEWRTVFPLDEMLWAGGSPKPVMRPFTKKSFYGSFLEPTTHFARHRPRIGYNEHRKLLQNEEIG